MVELKDNPFVVLGVSPRSTRDEIHEAVEDALLDADGGVDIERRLETARQSLIAPNERLQAEVGYLLELRPAEAKRAVAVRTSEEWIGIAQSTDGVAKVNALAQAVSNSEHAEDARRTFGLLFDSWALVNPTDVRTQINEERAVAGFPEAKIGDVRRALEHLREWHAAQALDCLDRHGNVSLILADFLEANLIPEKRMGEKFAASVIAAYSKRVSGVMAQAANQALNALQEFQASGNDTDFATFKRQLETWDEVAQPLQLASGSKGADESHSRELYEDIRSIAITLANGEDRQHDALKITQLATQVFAELPWAVDALRADTKRLDDNVAFEVRMKFLAPLAAALDRARKDLAATSHHLGSHGFSEKAPGPVGALFRGYAAVLSPKVDVEIRDLGANMVRSLSIALFNEREDALQAKILNAQLVADATWFSAELRNTIAEDEKQLISSIALQQVIRAMKDENWRKAKTILTELQSNTNSADLPALAELERIVDTKLRQKRQSLITVGVIGAIILGLMAMGESGNDDYADYDAVADTVEMPTAETLAGSDDYSEPLAGGSGAVEAVEEVAPDFSGGVFALPQVRYCARQSERLELARDMVESAGQLQRFNEAIDDFNFRCGSFRYDYADMATARAEIAAMTSLLRSQAADLVGESDPAPMVDYPAFASEPAPQEFDTPGFSSTDKSGVEPEPFLEEDRE